LGKPALLYIKHQGTIEVQNVKRLIRDGLLSAIKYAIVLDDPADDDYLRELTQTVDPNMIVSGMGEQPAVVHMRDFGLNGFTSGCVCVAPGLSDQMLKAIGQKDFVQAEHLRQTFKPLEDLRNRIHPVRVLHDAVTLSGIADMGPLLPLLSGIDKTQAKQVGAVAVALLDIESKQVARHTRSIGAPQS